LDFTLKNNEVLNEQIFDSFKSLFDFVKEEANILLERESEAEFESKNVNFYVLYSGPL
jgi:hypothetical protein